MPATSSRPYAVERSRVDGVDFVRLHGPRDVRVSIAPTIGNNAFEFMVGGKNAFWFPYSSVGEFAAQPALCGNPFLHPWANRLDEHAFYAGGTRYELNRGLGNYLEDQDGQPIHGLLAFARHWEVATVHADDQRAWVTSRLDFTRYPQWMAQFPFAHVVSMTYCLSGTQLEIRTDIENHGTEPLPVSTGFHPYVRLHDSPRDSWTIGLAARRVWDLNEQFTPRGTQSDLRDVLPVEGRLALGGQFLDHVFGDLQRDEDGWAHFDVLGGCERLTVAYGPEYPVAVVYAPTGKNRDFICFEPMSGITNAFNLAHRGIYRDLPVAAPSTTWSAKFRITVEGF